ncbi:hypothetical protein MSG28_015322 [Choristoneura fumiferana]|uniref:Uncharacterized protein n=1 Tax=Choristoneura fumiferana TaxID=7141 RepID=A0ACC0KB26_CHOFU|nr:hypothetical protein MSG28_015322 [Choristoneura fumiferana]
MGYNTVIVRLQRCGNAATSLRLGCYNVRGYNAGTMGLQKRDSAGFMSLAETHGFLCPSSQAIWYYSFMMTSSRMLFVLVTFLTHWVPAYLVDGAATVVGKKPQYNIVTVRLQDVDEEVGWSLNNNRWSKRVLEWRPWSDDLRKAAGRNWIRLAEDRAQRRSLGEAYVRQWTAISRLHDDDDDEATRLNMTRLFNEMCDADKHIFDFDTSCIDWNEYFANYMRGIRVYLLKDPLSTVPGSLKKFQRLKMLHYFVLTVIGLLFLRRNASPSHTPPPPVRRPPLQP